MYKILNSLILLFLTVHLFSSDPPYYETNGFGTNTSAGIHGEVYKVTNLDNNGYGSLRYGIEELDGSRLIVFEIGGVIDLEQEDLTISSGNITIAGQTAPFPGITLIKGGLRVRADNVVVQHITIRPGDAGHTSPIGWEPDGFNVTTKNVVFDHCSVSWSIDENMSVSRGGNNLTFYRCIIAEGLANSIHWKGEHSCGTLVMDGSQNISIIGNLYAHNYRRHPRLKDGTAVMYANNVVYNYGIYAAHIGGEQGDGYSSNPGKGTFLGNSFFKGPDGWDNYFLEGHKGDFDKDMNPGNGEAYLEDNIMLDRTNGEKLIPYDQHITILDNPIAVPTGFVPSSARENLETVLAHAGSRPAERSEEDKRIIQTLIDGTGSIIDSQNEVGGYPDYADSIRALTVPEDATERRAWLDSISVSLEKDNGLEATTFYSFVDEYWEEVNQPNSNSNNYLVTKNLNCYPNPITNDAQISFNLKQDVDVTIVLQDILGKSYILMEKTPYQSGDHLVSFSTGKFNLPEGIYYLQLVAADEIRSINLVIQ